MLVRTLERILASGVVSWVVVAAPESHLDITDEMLQSVVPSKVKLLVTVGGTTRQQSVASALLEVPDEAEIITVHDAARPCLEPSWIVQTADLCRRFDGAIVAVPSVDTLKEVTRRTHYHSDVITRTVSREIIWQAQTPQTFRTGVLRRAVEHAQQTNLSGTDEASLVEAIGGSVAVIRGSHLNIKVTNYSDWEYLEWKLSHD